MATQAALTEVLNSSELADAFRLFLEGRHCEENLYFWADIQGFRFSPSTTTQDQLNARAQEIIQKYFDSSAEFMINVDDLFVKAIKSEIQTAGVNRFTFDKAMNACLTLLLEDSLPKFFKSQSYLAITEKKNIKRKKSEKEIMKLFKELKFSADTKFQEAKSVVNKTSECVVEFEPLNAEKLKESSEKVLEGKEWISQGKNCMNIVENVILAVSDDTRAVNESENVFIEHNYWETEIESLSLIICCPKYRTVRGFLYLFGSKWANWDPGMLKILNQSETSFPDMIFSFSMEPMSKQVICMQFFELIRSLLEKYPNDFQFTSNFILLLTKLVCCKLPGMSFLRILDEDESPISIGIIGTLKDLLEFMNKYPKLFFSHFDVSSAEYILPNSHSLFAPGPNQINLENSHWNSSFLLQLLKEIEKIEREKREVCVCLAKSKSLLEYFISLSETISKFLASLTDVTDEIQFSYGTPVVLTQSVEQQEIIMKDQEEKRRRRTNTESKTKSVPLSSSSGISLRKSLLDIRKRT